MNGRVIEYKSPKIGCKGDGENEVKIELWWGVDVVLGGVWNSVELRTAGGEMGSRVLRIVLCGPDSIRVL